MPGGGYGPLGGTPAGGPTGPRPGGGAGGGKLGSPRPGACPRTTKPGGEAAVQVTRVIGFGSTGRMPSSGTGSPSVTTGLAEAVGGVAVRQTIDSSAAALDAQTPSAMPRLLNHAPS